MLGKKLSSGGGNLKIYWWGVPSWHIKKGGPRCGPKKGVLHVTKKRGVLRTGLLKSEGLRN